MTPRLVSPPSSKVREYVIDMPESEHRKLTIRGHIPRVHRRAEASPAVKFVLFALAFVAMFLEALLWRL